MHAQLPYHFPKFSSPAPPPSGGRLPPTSGSRPTTMSPQSFLVVSLVFLIFLNVIVSADESETPILLKFKNSLKNSAALSDWIPSGQPCGPAGPWTGVFCDSGVVSGLRLENVSLEGSIDVETLSGLPNLRSVSFMNNNLGGNLPEFSKLGSLKAVYLSHNRFSGEIGERTFAGMGSLKKLHLADNKLTGKISSSLAALPRLIELTLNQNQFEGALPDFPADRLQVFNVSNNKLSGEIPQGLQNFDVSLFYGNRNLCGGPLVPCPIRDQIPDPTPSDHQGSNLSHGTLIITIVSSLLALVALIALSVVIIILLRRLKDLQQSNPNAAAINPAVTGPDVEQGLSATKAAPPTSPPKQNTKLTFLREGAGKFEMSDLLNASAEHLGNGVLGNTYKASLGGGNTVVVVKRFKRMKNGSRVEFNEHMRRLGRLDHPNVLPIVAFYCKKDDKILVTDYAANASLAAQIQRRSRALDWPARLGVVKGVALGLQHLHAELPSLAPAHGNLKSSNVLLDKSFEPLLTDYGLIPIVNQELGQQHMMAYKSPEYRQRRKLDRRNDIWSFGILILEILTGKPPGGNDVDLAKWVEATVQNNEDYGGAMVVFDRSMAGSSHSHGEMAKLLKIGLDCCREKPEDRPEIKEVVKMIEEIKEKDFDDDFYTTYSEDADFRSSRGLSDDFKTLNF